MNAQLRELILTGTTFGLAALAAPLPAFAASPPALATHTVTVTNARSVPVAVYAEQGVFDTRIGTVGANSQKELTLPKYEDPLEDVRIVVHPELGEDLESPDLTEPLAGSMKLFVPNNDVGWVPVPQPFVPGIDPNRTTVTVSNPSDETVKVLLEKDVFDTNLGTVEPNQIKTFDIPSYLAEEEAQVQLFLRPAKGFDLSSQFLDLHPKAHYEVVVPKRG